jgi:2-polyprenyl-6-hydroxyphenyl methylase/3-demethylubiquinone-9 3-methyltransferase
MARQGATDKGIYLAEKPLRVAALHSLETQGAVEYERVAAEDLAAREPGAYDVVTCMEMLEHVPEPASTVASCASLANPGGHVFFSTINRNAKAYLLAVVGAEYVLGLLPKGTHDYGRFIKPAELARWCREAGLEVRDIVGMTYNPLTRVASLGRDADVNYLVHAVKPGA